MKGKDVTLYFRERILTRSYGEFIPLREREEKKKKVASDDRRARDIPSKQDKSWVGEQQMQQEQFDKTEFEKREAKRHPRRRICH